MTNDFENTVKVNVLPMDIDEEESKDSVCSSVCAVTDVFVLSVFLEFLTLGLYLLGRHFDSELCP